MTRYHWPGNVRELRNAVERAIVLGDRDTIQPHDLPPQIAQPGGAPRASSPGLPDQRPRQRNSPPTPPLGSAITSAPMPTIDPLPAPAMAPVSSSGGTGPRAPATPIAKSLRELEKEGILAALAVTGGNKAQAAAILEIDRSTLYKKLKDYDIEG
jgi:DNA-binding NtrC family response regulator